MNDQEIYAELDTPLEVDNILPADFLDSMGELPAVDTPDPAEQNLAPSAQVQITVVNRGGMPVKVLKPSQFRTETEEILMQAMSLPLTEEAADEFLKNANMIQKSAYHLALKAAAGDLDAMKYAFDRILGKPKQQTESFNVSTTYEKWLESLEDETERSD